MISKLKYKLTSVALGLILSPLATASAIGGVDPVVPPEQIRIKNLIITITNWGFGLLIIVAAAFILFAAYLYLTAGQNPENQAKAKNYILYAVIAIIVGFVARGLVDIVVKLLQTGV